jgi:hypothetical protein
MGVDRFDLLRAHLVEEAVDQGEHWFSLIPARRN